MCILYKWKGIVRNRRSSSFNTYYRLLALIKKLLILFTVKFWLLTILLEYNFGKKEIYLAK